MGRAALSIVTGAASGIGRATARALASRGDRVLVVDLDSEGGAATCADIQAAGGSAFFLALDLTVDDSIRSAAAEIRSEHGAPVCNDNGFMHGLTLAPIQPSGTYDMGTWTFDSEGDYEASTYIQRTSMGGKANTQWDLRGIYVGSGLPALPLVGMGAMALGLLVVGARTVIRKK